MRSVQAVALGLFEKHGYANVTVEDVAKAADVGVASIFRNFGTKERLVMWDEYDPEIFVHVAERLKSQPVLTAVCEGIIDTFRDIYERDVDRILTRVKLMRATPALVNANLYEIPQARAAFEQLLKTAIPDPLRRSLTAATIVATLEVTINKWVDQRRREPPLELIRKAFAHLEQLQPPIPAPIESAFLANGILSSL